MPTYGEMFAGVGGLSLPFHRAGWECRWVSELDPNASKVLARRFGVPNLGDVTQVDWTEVEPVDLLIGGGFPCQPFSSAGQRKGGADARYLWPEVARAIRALGPRWVVLENVADILRFPEYGDIMRDLAQAGFDADWTVLRASDVGAPHRRQRWFCWATAAITHGRDSQPRPRGHRLRESDHEVGQHDNGGRPDQVSASNPNGEGRDRLSERDSGAGRLQGRRGQGPCRDDADGRAVAVADPESKRREWGGVHGNGGLDLRTTVANAHEQGREGSSRPEGRKQSEPHFVWGAYEPAVRRWERILNRPAPYPVVENTKGNPALSSQFVEWMMGFPAGWVTDVIDRRPALKALGNAVVPQVAECIAAQLRDHVGTPTERNGG